MNNKGLRDMPIRFFHLPLIASAVLVTALPARAQDNFYSSSDGSVSTFAGIGLTNLQAGEYVYDGGHKLSQLDWESKNVPTAKLGATLELGYNWRLKGKLDFGMKGDGHMVDRDWVDYSIDDWTHQSVHPDTKLDHYLNGTIEADRTIYQTDSTRLALGGGLGYSDVQWSAYGGSYVYSSYSLHDTVGTFADGEKGITYRQKIPVAFVSANAEQRIGALTLAGGLQGGATFGISDIDDHWMRYLRFTDDMKPAPMIGANVSLDYQLLPSASIYVAGDYQKVYHAKGDTKVESTLYPASAKYDDAAGADFQAWSVSFGVKGTF